MWGKLKSLLTGEQIKATYKRKHERINVKLTVSIDGIETRPIVDLSLGGMFIYTREDYVLNQTVNLKFITASGGEFLQVTGMIVNVRLEKGIGVQFINLEEKDLNKIKDYLEKLWFQVK